VVLTDSARKTWGTDKTSGFGGSDPSQVEILLQKGIQLLLFGSREWVDLAALLRSVGSEFNGVIPQLGSR